MKLFINILFLFIAAQSFGQQWRDSLDVARKAYKDKEYGKAMRYYESAQKNAPENIDLSDEMGQSAYKAREFEKAEKIYQQNGNSKSSGKQKADNYHNLGNSRMKSKNYDGAIDAYKEALRNNPDDEKTRYNLSEAIRKKKESDKKKQQQNQQNQQNQKNQQSQQGNQNQQGQQNQQGNQNQQGQGNQNSQNQQGDSQSGNSGSDQKQGQLPNKTVDKMLDDLMKKEAETKRRMSGNGGGGKSPKSGKDW